LVDIFPVAQTVGLILRSINLISMCAAEAASKGDVTELNWHDLAFDELTNGQAVMHYSRHRLAAFVNTLLAHWSVLQKLNRVSSVGYIALQACRDGGVKGLSYPRPCDVWGALPSLKQYKVHQNAPL